MNKADVYAFLNKKGISYKAIEHDAVYTVEQASALNLPHPESGGKNLFLRDDKKRNYYLFTVRDNRTVSIKELREKIGSRKLCFASEEDLYRIMQLIRGSVTPFGILNDEERIVNVYIDSWFRGNLISVHPNENTATVFLYCDDLIDVVREHGNVAEYIEFSEEI